MRLQYNVKQKQAYFTNLNDCAGFQVRAILVTLLTVFVLVLPAGNVAAEQSIQASAQKLKSEVVDLNRALFKLEEELLYPADTQVALFLSLKTKNKFLLDSIEIKIDGQIATTYLYSEAEIKALEQGGIQRLYMGNISSGPHKLSAVFNGQGANDHYFRKEKIFKFEKSNRSKFIEISLSDSQKVEPEFKFTEWH